MLLVGKNLPYGSNGTANGAVTPDLLVAGSIGGYAIDPADGVLKLVVSGASGTGTISASGLQAKSVTFYQGLGNGKVRQSEPHYVKGVQQFSAIPYEAATAQVTFIGSNGTDGNIGYVPPASTYFFPRTLEAWIRIRGDVTSRADYDDTYYISLTGRIEPTDTNETIVDRLVEAANTQHGDLLTAAKVTQGTDNFGISLTFKELGKTYTVTIGGVIENAPVRSSGGFQGAGTYDRVLAQEIHSNVHRGDLYRYGNMMNLGEVPETVEAGAQYELLYLHSVNFEKDRTGHKANDTANVYTWFAVVNGGAQYDELVAIAEALTGVEAEEAPEEPAP